MLPPRPMIDTSWRPMRAARLSGRSVSGSC